MSNIGGKKITRREILKAAGAAGLAISFPSIVPSTVFGKKAPSNRINVGMIGMGRQAIYANTNPFLNSEDCRIVAVCDVDKWRLGKAKEKVDTFYKNTDCKTYGDWREVVGRSDIDAIMNSTSDQWHVPISLAAVGKGKHVCCEKPLTLSINEGRTLADAAKKHGVVFRTDSECRSAMYMHLTSELVINGYLGNIKRIEVGVPAGDKAGGDPTPMEVPEELDYDMWVGPAPMKPYTLDRVHPREGYGRPGWMRCRDTCEGMITNWGTHLLDVAQLLNGTERTGPISVEATGKYPEPGSGLWNVLTSFRAQYKYASGVVLDYLIKSPYLRVEGDEGWIHANWLTKGGILAHDRAILHTKFKDTDIRLPQRPEKDDFIYAIKNSCNTMADAEVGHRTCSVGQLAHIAIQRGKKLNWDPKAERFTNDDGANKMLVIGHRKPWELEKM
ncbi:MAG: Gfo/Idh/MocA family oxidoreductase [Phycisphaerae bacterium]|nr:Gfo/Idh/MocA family oxidoreductase [Phycisphaerae bacterium]